MSPVYNLRKLYKELQLWCSWPDVAGWIIKLAQRKKRNNKNTSLLIYLIDTPKIKKTADQIWSYPSNNTSLKVRTGRINIVLFRGPAVLPLGGWKSLDPAKRCLFWKGRMTVSCSSFIISSRPAMSLQVTCREAEDSRLVKGHNTQ